MSKRSQWYRWKHLLIFNCLTGKNFYHSPLQYATLQWPWASKYKVVRVFCSCSVCVCVCVSVGVCGCVFICLNSLCDMEASIGFVFRCKLFSARCWGSSSSWFYFCCLDGLLLLPARGPSPDPISLVLTHLCRFYALLPSLWQTTFLVLHSSPSSVLINSVFWNHLRQF